ncbi:prostaglandin F synthase 1-like [Tachyglossus aculeatus]|uniref:prostaglandin F synthase 1-like n=1 Tax=Tachyglossus aculeatus TaxID=9261 RepID=UPI0018F5BEC8|nr:prostaglandin F synthase 1-like [Tachyglossus aculeatus]
MNFVTARHMLLNDGNKIPVLGFGTFGLMNAISEGEMAVKKAIEVGFRHIDGASLYENEREVGRAIQAKIADGTVTREDIFYTGKLWSSCHYPTSVRPALEETLKNLQLDYLNLYIIHWPVTLKPGMDLEVLKKKEKLSFDYVDLCTTWEALEVCKDAGLTKSIGVSNFNHKQLEMILTKPGLKYKPVCNQVECHPYLNQSKLLEFCKANSIALVAYSALGSQVIPTDNPSYPVLLEDPVLGAIAKKHNRTPALVALRYQLQRGVVVLAKSFTENRIKENIQVFDFQLNPEDMKAIDGLNRNYRYIQVEMFSSHPNYPFNEEY